MSYKTPRDMDSARALPTRPTRARVSLGAVAHNFAIAREYAGAREVIAVVKADAYGHGAVAVSRALLRAGARLLAVATTSELAVLRAAGIDAPALLLGGVHGPLDAQTALSLGATPVLHHEAQRAWVEAAAADHGARATVHVEIDTGMHRLGVPADEAAALVARVAGSPHLRLGGVATHFARADELDPEPTRAQAEAFARVLDELARRGIDPGLVHLANSAGLLGGSSWENSITGSAVRPGLMLYGIAPAPHFAKAGLEPVMTLETAVAALRRIEAGEGVGYGATWRAPRSGWIATLPMGYADGFPWSAGRPEAHAEVLIAGRRRPLVGRVSMDLVTVWLEEDSVSIGEPAIAFGVGAGGRLPVESLANAAATLPYELVVRVGARVPREWTA
jgi:alanine racemase